MKIQSNRVSTMIDFFKDQLKDYYSADEINGLIFYSFNHVLGFNRNDLLMKKEKNINESDLLIFFRIVKDLKLHKPIQYILGDTEFYNCKIKVDSNVLIPRPETEELVDWIIKDHSDKDNVKILDIGTGSGCIPIALKANLPKADVSALDVSAAALELASANAKRNNVRIRFILEDILKPTILTEEDVFDIIVSNPPYVKEEEKALMNRNVLEHEPHLALFVKDNDPLLFYRSIIDFSKKHLSENGYIYFEINEQYGNEIMQLLKVNGFDIELRKDLSGKDRMIKARRL